MTNIAKKYNDFGAYEWVNYLENTSDEPTEIISELWDGDVTLPFEHEDKRFSTAYTPNIKTETRIFAPTGSVVSADEFYCDVDRNVECNLLNHIYPGNTKRYATHGGRSSDINAPFFNISKNNGGVIVAVGWTGQWNCEISRGEDSVTIKTKIEDTSLRLLGKEKFRTSSIVIMPYECSMNESQNMWRRLVKSEFSLIGKPGRDEHGPFSAGIWGGMRTSSVKKRIETIVKEKIPFENVWMDAGWYGADTEPTPDEYVGDWPKHTGDWVVSQKIHPGGLADVSEEIHNGKMKFILWFEPERVISSTPIVSAHPEYFLRLKEQNDNLLLNLGNDEAWSYCFETLSGFIEKLKIDFYRQDFNFEPLFYWRCNDSEDRKGVSEIKHINGLYRLWDALLKRFPHLMIDNCASGGRRIDIETLRRSVPLWRSDYMCPANFDACSAQCHHQSFNTWLPYSGSGTGRIYDLYHVRSCYSAALSTNYTFSESDDFGAEAEKIKFIKKFAEEYKRVRPYFSENFYPLTEFSLNNDVWCASQFDRPTENDGIVQVFRRENSPYETAVLRLNNVDENSAYTFTDADGGSFSVSGRELLKAGFVITIKTQRTAKIFFYKKATSEVISD